MILWIGYILKSLIHNSLAKGDIQVLRQLKSTGGCQTKYTGATGIQEQRATFQKEEKNLEVANDDLRKEIYAKRVRAQEIRQDAQNMKDEMRRVLRELEQMEEEELMIKRQISAATNGEMSRLGSLMTDVKLEKVSDDDDPVIEHHQLQEVATNDVPFRIRT